MVRLIDDILMDVADDWSGISGDHTFNWKFV